jgi:hypothetical protein
MKKLINGTGTLLEESLAGFAAAHAGIVTLGEEGKFVRRRDLKRANFDFHFGLYRLSKMPALIGMIENLWIQHGPMLNYLYPEGHPASALVATSSCAQPPDRADQSPRNGAHKTGRVNGEKNGQASISASKALP